MRLPAGEGEIVMEFNPRSLHTTGIAATISIILIYLLLAAAITFTAIRYHNHKKQPQ